MVLNFVLGTAAELIKIHPVIRAARERGHQARVIATGQSRAGFLMQYRDLGLPEDILVWLLPHTADLDNSVSALKWFARAWLATRAADELILQPGFLVVHGDTLSTYIGARHGRRRGLPVVHIEAGLRSPSLWNPFPEEIIRRRVSRLARVHMAPDAIATDNLIRAGVRGEVVCTGANTLVDSVRLCAEADGAAAAGPEGPFALANIHRYENLNRPARWRVVVSTLLQAATRRRVILVAHPQTRGKLAGRPELRAQFDKAGIEVVDRLPFSRFIALLRRAEFLISDGGSNQEECHYLGKPCLLLRQETERREGLDGGSCLLSRFDTRAILDFLADPRRFERAPPAFEASPSTRVIDFLENVQDHGRKSPGKES
jgi:UDP-N-acetylglucosamine 2-epimerase (non-hydrolysing)